MNTLEKFANKLKLLREINDLTQEQLAVSIGISRVTLGHYEKAKRKPDIEILNEIANYFNVSADYLLGNKETPDGNPISDAAMESHIQILMNQIPENMRDKFFIVFNNIIIGAARMDLKIEEHGIGERGDVTQLIITLLNILHTMLITGEKLSSNTVNGEYLPVSGKEWEYITLMNYYEYALQRLIEFKGIIEAVVKKESAGSYDQFLLKARLMVLTDRDKRQNVKHTADGDVERPVSKSEG